MKTLTTEKINEIRSSVDIVDVVMRYIPLTKKGKNYFGVCPFHEDSDPSLSVSPEKQIFSCFSCHTAGNVFTFVMEYEHISFLEAVKMVADIGGINVEIDSPKYVKNSYSKIYDIYEVGQKFYTNNIQTAYGKLAKEYLAKRGILDEQIKEFEIGLAIKSSDSLSKILQKKEFSEKDLIESALIVKDERGFHDFFYDRIVFPLHDTQGKVVGYSGRIYKEMKDAPKYINSKEHTLFKKGEFLYNYARAKEECRKKNTVIIMEGFMDVIRASTVGIKNVVATMGTAVTKEHIQLLKRLASNIILCFDGDKAGNKATFACCNELVNHGIIPKIVRLEENLDPDEYVLKYGKDKFLEKLDNPMSVTDYKLLYYKQTMDLTSSEGKAKYASIILKELGNIEDDILREVTLKKISEETDLDIDFLREKIENKERVKTPVIKPITIKENKYDQAQAALLFYMLRNSEVINKVKASSIYFPNQEYRLLYREIEYFYDQNHTMIAADFFSDLEESMMKTVGKIESLPMKEEYTSIQIQDYIDAIMEKNIEDQIDRLEKKIKTETDLSKQIEISQKIVELKRRSEKNV